MTKSIIIEKQFEGWPDQSEEARRCRGQVFLPSETPVEVPDEFADDVVAKGLARVAGGATTKEEDHADA